MKKTSLLAAAAVLLLGSAGYGFAQSSSSPGMSGAAPGQEMQKSGSQPGMPGASGYAPGHSKDADDVKKNRSTTGAGTSDTMKKNTDTTKTKKY